MPQATSEISSRPGTKILQAFNTTDIFSGVSVEAAVDNVDSLLALDRSLVSGSPRRLSSNRWRSLSLFPVRSLLSNYTIRWNDKGARQAYDRRYQRQRAVVAIVDTGVYYPHPDVRQLKPSRTLSPSVANDNRSAGGFGPGFNVAGGYDYVGDGGNRYNYGSSRYAFLSVIGRRANIWICLELAVHSCGAR